MSPSWFVRHRRHEPAGSTGSMLMSMWLKANAVPLGGVLKSAVVQMTKWSSLWSNEAETEWTANKQTEPSCAEQAGNSGWNRIKNWFTLTKSADGFDWILHRTFTVGCLFFSWKQKIKQCNPNNNKLCFTKLSQK